MGMLDKKSDNGEPRVPATAAGMALMGARAARDVSRQVELLDLILEALDTGASQLCISDVAPQPGLQKDFPVMGAQRWILERTPDGRDLPLVAGEDTEILPANVNRLGGSIVNRGEKPVLLYLAKASQKGAGTATIYLAANGGSWDFRLGNLLWCGSITANAQGGVTTLSIAEV